MKEVKKYVLFDMAGTIVSSRIDWERENLAGANHLVKYLGGCDVKITEPTEFISEIMGQARIGRRRAKEERVEYSIEQIIVEQLKKQNIELDNGLIKKALCEYIKPELERTFPYKGMALFLKKLEEQDYELFLISNTPTKEFVEMTIDKYDLRKYFTYVLTSCEVGYRKPHDLFLRHLIEFGKPDMQNSVFVGDRLKDDMESAKRLGIKGIFFNKVDHSDNERDRQVIIPEVEVDNLVDLYQAIVEALNIERAERVRAIL